MELKNYQPPEADRLVELEVKTTWLTDVYTCSFFDEYCIRNLKNNHEKGNYQQYDRYQLAVEKI